MNTYNTCYQIAGSLKNLVSLVSGSHRNNNKIEAFSVYLGLNFLINITIYLKAK